MHTRFLGCLVATAAVGAPAKDSFGLKGEFYRAGLKIEMKNAANRKLTTVEGRHVSHQDRGQSNKIHNFRLRGPGINRATSIPRTTETIWTVQLKRGTYTFLCDPHAGTMRGSFPRDLTRRSASTWPKPALVVARSASPAFSLH